MLVDQGAKRLEEVLVVVREHDADHILSGLGVPRHGSEPNG
jgi:hypothetical protein